MSLLTPDLPFGQPAFALSADQIATVLDLICRGAQDARADVKLGMLEVPTTMIVRKAMRRVKKRLELTNLEIRGEHELENMATKDAAILARIDITLNIPPPVRRRGRLCSYRMQTGRRQALDSQLKLRHQRSRSVRHRPIRGRTRMGLHAGLCSSAACRGRGDLGG